jgi:poly-gamma-glutamate synthesis protein (capsule biosynthesis protein)
MVWIRNNSAGKDGIIVYSLGNFISNQRKPKTDGGSMVRIELSKESDTLRITKAG